MAFINTQLYNMVIPQFQLINSREMYNYRWTTLTTSMLVAISAITIYRYLDMYR